MATIYNPTGTSLWCEPLRRELQPRETAEATARQASACSTAIFVVTRDEEPPAVAPEVGDSPGIDAPVATRKQGVRGAAVVEETGGPVGETR